VPQRVNFLVEQAGKPVHKKLIENGATSQLNPLNLLNLVHCAFPSFLLPDRSDILIKNYYFWQASKWRYLTGTNLKNSWFINQKH
ncbi:hypothetical protein QUB20_17030, partial [Microcoleus sp. B4-C2]|uniref:hypothetical protein n=1 Tax=Microcoleus sp. B4-C2 TaxID=2818661 RepID=UPI002FD70784